MKEADFTQVIDTNLVGPFLMSKAVLPGMANRNGSIINITSVAGLYGNASQPTKCFKSWSCGTDQDAGQRNGW